MSDKVITIPELRVLGYDARVLGTHGPSVDLGIWPSVFAGSGDGRVPPLLRPNDSVVCFGELGPGALWKDLAYLEYCLRANAGRFMASYDVVAVGVAAGEASPADWGRPPEPHPGWELLGYEVADLELRSPWETGQSLYSDCRDALERSVVDSRELRRSLRVYALWRVDRVEAV